MRQYEVAVVLHPDLEIDLDRAAGKVEAIITGLGGKIDKKDAWGKRKLAYKIKKQDWGIYIFYTVSLDPSQVQQLDNTLRITDEVMRYLVVSLENIRILKKPTKKTKTKQD
ncbi:30S ribosomal protein S6 [Candidatus Saccharibacteria bacterium]|nr:30S ribosomal protein S6 [Candidatus Saccharibacteria bacterium]